MCKNIGCLDKIIRIILGILIIAWGIYANNYLGLVGIIPLLTGLLGYCPLYSLFKINTSKTCKCSCEHHKKEEEK